MPATSMLRSKSGSGSQRIEGVTGGVEATSGSGSIVVRRSGGRVRASTDLAGSQRTRSAASSTPRPAADRLRARPSAADPRAHEQRRHRGHADGRGRRRRLVQFRLGPGARGQRRRARLDVERWPEHRGADGARVAAVVVIWPRHRRRTRDPGHGSRRELQLRVDRRRLPGHGDRHDGQTHAQRLGARRRPAAARPHVIRAGISIQ